MRITGPLCSLGHKYAVYAHPLLVLLLLITSSDDDPVIELSSVFMWSRQCVKSIERISTLCVNTSIIHLHTVAVAV